jgi:Nucleotidyl transferase AbiEii toxin, Type IV TA system
MTPRARPATLEDLKKLLAALHREGADYLLIGAYALLAHGYPRATVDIDLIVPARRDAAEPIRRALLVLADRSAQELVPEWFEEGEGIRVADEIVVDLVFRTCGETFDTLRPFEIAIDLDGVPLRTVNLEGLLRTKQSARERDVSDRRIIEQALQARKP